MDKDKRIGIDIDPKFPGIIKKDFLLWNPPNNKKICVIGNPPFGKNSSLAVKFFNYSAQFSEAIAFILPKTFRKTSIIKRLDIYFHLIFDEDTHDNSFLFNNKIYNVNCCSQIWIKKQEQRVKDIFFKKEDFIKWFEFVDYTLADFSFQRVGRGRRKNYKK